MINKIRVLFLGLFSFGLIFTTSAGVVMAADCNAADNTKSALQCGVDSASGNTKQTSDQAQTGLNKLFSTILNLLSVAVGIAAVVMVIIGGFRLITSSGNPDKVKGGRSAIVYAVIGIVVVVLAQLIVRFVLDKTVSASTASSDGSGTNCVVQGGGVPICN